MSVRDQEAPEQQCTSYCGCYCSYNDYSLHPARRFLFSTRTHTRKQPLYPFQPEHSETR